MLVCNTAFKTVNVRLFNSLVVHRSVLSLFSIIPLRERERELHTYISIFGIFNLYPFSGLAVKAIIQKPLGARIRTQSGPSAGISMDCRETYQSYSHTGLGHSVRSVGPAPLLMLIFLGLLNESLHQSH